MEHTQHESGRAISRATCARTHLIIFLCLEEVATLGSWISSCVYCEQIDRDVMFRERKAKRRLEQSRKGQSSGPNTGATAQLQPKPPVIPAGPASPSPHVPELTKEKQLSPRVVAVANTVAAPQVVGGLESKYREVIHQRDEAWKKLRDHRFKDKRKDEALLTARREHLQAVEER